MKIGIYSNPNKDEKGELFAEICEIAKKNGVAAEKYASDGKYDLLYQSAATERYFASLGSARTREYLFSALTKVRSDF